MRLSEYYLPIIKETPKDATIASHRLMVRAGMVRNSASGIFTWLPLGHKALQKVENIVREEMDKAGCLEVTMPTIQPADLWVESGRYEDYGKEMLRIQDRHGKAMLYGPTHEEVITDIFRNTVHSYKDLPKNLYQIQWKFRDEIRPRFGVLRGREFLMKDNYSFDLDYEGALKSYNNMFKAYYKTFYRMGLKPIAVSADSGAIGGNLSHEFQIMAGTGESEIFFDKRFLEIDPEAELDVENLKTMYSAADEMHDPAKCPLSDSELATSRGIEVGHVFYFGTKYSDAMNTKVLGKDGKEITLEMGSYGIGVSRVVGAIIEASHDEKGIVWPKEVAPFAVSLLNLKISDNELKVFCDEIYELLKSNNIDTLYDDTDNSAGKKFANHDLLGFPYQLSIGPRSMKEGKIEVKERATGQKQELSKETIIDFLKSNLNA